ncbi:excisionase family DNA-binding protein [Subtercola sp. Z020]|uniref:excisionase family DNA-binding protein n=1 Tax=Subtercola sp. Z020 TaxID=2080582 RepID=UPI0035141C62
MSIRSEKCRGIPCSPHEIVESGYSPSDSNFTGRLRIVRTPLTHFDVRSRWECLQEEWSITYVNVRNAVTIDDAGYRLSVSRSTVYRLIQAKRLRTIHIGSSVRIPIDAIEDLIKESPSGRTEMRAEVSR